MYVADVMCVADGFFFVCAKFRKVERVRLRRKSRAEGDGEAAAVVVVQMTMIMVADLDREANVVAEEDAAAEVVAVDAEAVDEVADVIRSREVVGVKEATVMPKKVSNIKKYELVFCYLFLKLNLGERRRPKKTEGGEDGEFNDEKPKEFYIPPEPSMDEAEVFGQGITSGINFEKYDKIPVNVSNFF